MLPSTLSNHVTHEMSRAIELHDSTLAAIVAKGSALVLQFRPAYVHESDGVCGVDAGRGFTQFIDIELENGVLRDVPSIFPARISDGTLVVPGGAPSGFIPLPFEMRHGLTIQLRTERNEKLSLEATCARSIQMQDAHFIEQFPGANASNNPSRLGKTVDPLG